MVGIFACIWLSLMPNVDKYIPYMDPRVLGAQEFQLRLIDVNCWFGAPVLWDSKGCL